MVDGAFIRTWTTLFFIILLSEESKGWLFPALWTSCYDSPPIGCFPTSSPFTNSGGIGPQDPAVIPTYFNSSRAGLPSQVFTATNAEQVMRDRYDPTKQTVLIIHGYMEDTSRSWVQRMLAELHRKEDANYITVDWGAGAENVNYYQSVANTRVVGAVVALVLQTLKAMGGDPAQFYLIGYSLGAHIAGYAGSRVEGLGRITGLDPAGPAFEGTPAEVRLDPSDALLVDVIHTDGDQGVGLGTLQAMGHVDFYPNRGAEQPGCPSSVFDRFTAAFLSSLGNALACSHFRVLDLFSASINNLCPASSLISNSLRISWSSRAHDEEVTDGQQWLPCASRESCPLMGYGLNPESIDLCRQQQQQQQQGGNLLVAMQTTATWPFCCKLQCSPLIIDNLLFFFDLIFSPDYV